MQESLKIQGLNQSKSSPNAKMVNKITRATDYLKGMNTTISVLQESSEDHQKYSKKRKSDFDVSTPSAKKLAT